MRLFAFVFSMVLLAGAAQADTPATMRVDYFHGGNNETEMFSLDQVVIEPLPFSGNLGQPHDQTNRGKYLFEIVDPESGDIAWSRSFSSIYGEWETIGEARETIEDVIEPYLIQQGFMMRTPRGRLATNATYRHLGLPAARAPAPPGDDLFDSDSR